MRSSSVAVVLALAFAAAGCGSKSKAAPFEVVTGDNVVPISVSGTCGSRNAYLNEPCVTATVCAPGSTTNCQIIGGLLLDTGSYGLRVFGEVLSPGLRSALPAVQATSGALAECVQYADGSVDWGPVVTADVVLAKEPAVNVPIQIIDPTFGGTVPAGCHPAGTILETTPDHFNGILGVGPFVQDCSDATCPASSNGPYFAVNGASAAPVAVDAPYQVQNPVALLPTDSNGIIVVLPSVGSGGVGSADGALVLGIGTRSNNNPSGHGAAAVGLDGHGEFTTVLNGSAMSGSFIDTGSNGLFFDAPTIPRCATPDQAWYCPSSPLSFSATLQGGGPNHLGASFQVDDFERLVNTGNAVFPNVAGTGVANGFDWGLPFFLGKTVYLGIAGKGSVFGNGPLFAY